MTSLAIIPFSAIANDSSCCSVTNNLANMVEQEYGDITGSSTKNSQERIDRLISAADGDKVLATLAVLDYVLTEEAISEYPFIYAGALQFVDDLGLSESEELHLVSCLASGERHEFILTSLMNSFIMNVGKPLRSAKFENVARAAFNNTPTVSPNWRLVHILTSHSKLDGIRVLRLFDSGEINDRVDFDDYDSLWAFTMSEVVELSLSESWSDNYLAYKIISTRPTLASAQVLDNLTNSCHPYIQDRTNAFRLKSQEK